MLIYRYYCAKQLGNIFLVRWHLYRQFLSLKSRDQTLTNEKIRSPTCACYFGSQKDSKTHTRKHFSTARTPTVQLLQLLKLLLLRHDRAPSS